MRIRAALLTVSLAAASATVAAQSNTAEGVAALARGDYQRAVEILRPLAEVDSGGDPAAQFFLGTMYEAGFGVPRDPMRACALYHRAGISDPQPFGAAAMRLHKAAFQRNGAEFFAECQFLGNLGFDHRFEPVTFELGAGHSVAWSLRNATVSYRGQTTQHRMQLAGRGAAFLPLRYTPLQVPGTAGTRHFIEVFVWVPTQWNGWVLTWRLFEVDGAKILSIADADALMTSPVKPPASTPEDVRQRVAVRMNGDGQAEWAILEGPSARSGLIESPEERREIREREEARRAALENVDWNRRFDARRLPSLAYASTGGCGNILLHGTTADRGETISVHADRNALQLSTTVRTFDIARYPDAIAVNVVMYEHPIREAEPCNDAPHPRSAVTETWRAVSGRVTIELTPPGGRARTPSLYRATIRLDDTEFLDSAGRRHRQTGPIVLSGLAGWLGG